MNGQIIDLTDGTRLEVKVNFGTLYHMQKCGGADLARRLSKKQKKKQRITDNENMEFSAKVIYALLRSNGKQITFDEALELMPSDTDSITSVVKAYNAELERIKKKEDAKKAMKMISQK